MQLRWEVLDHSDLHRIGIILRELGNKFEILSDAKRYPLQEALFSARGHRLLAQNRLRSKPKAGRAASK
jgi:hypothetical protein